MKRRGRGVCEKLHDKDSGLNWKRDVGGERLVRRTDRQSDTVKSECGPEIN